MVARDGRGPKIARSVTSCAECLAWGRTYSQGVCLACYNFARRRHDVDCCGACARRMPLEAGYCRLCWCQAREDRLAPGGDTRSVVVIAPHLPHVRFHQLFLAGMTQRRAKPRTTPRRYGAKGHPLKPPPAAVARPNTASAQLALFSLEELARDYSRLHFDLRQQAAPDNPWLAWALHHAHSIAEARGWAPSVRRSMQRVLVRLLAYHHDSDVVRTSDVRVVASRYSCNVDHAAEILEHMRVLVDDEPATFDTWLAAKLNGLAPQIARDVHRWTRWLHDGGPRSQARHPKTAHSYLRLVRPALLDWSVCYHHLREVTHDDVLANLRGLRAHTRYGMVPALRSLFTWARKNGVVFRNPATGIKLGKREHPVWQPLSPAEIAAAVAAASTPQARVFLALAAVHAARPGAIRGLQLNDVDLTNRRLTLAGRERPLDELTYRALRQWLAYRAHRWPHTANPHVLISKESALDHRPVNHRWMLNLRGLPANVERLRIDRQLEEALAVGGDPLHLAMVFGIAEATAIRYATNARQLLERPHGDPAPSSTGTEGST